MRRLIAVLLWAFPAQAEQITLSGPAIWETAPLIALAQTQPLAPQGITLVFEPWSAVQELRQGLMQPEPLLAVSPSLTAALYQARGIPFAPQSAVASGGSLWLIGTGADISQASDLHGLKLALPFQGHLPDLLLRRITRDAPQAYDPLYVPDYMAAMQMMLVGKADAVLLPEPLASNLLQQAPQTRRLADICDLWQGATDLGTCPVAGMLIANPAANRADLRQAYDAAFAALAQDPGRAAALLGAAFAFLPPSDPAAYAQIRAQQIDLSHDAAPLLDFYAEIYKIAPEALGGALPPSTFFEPGPD